MQKGIGKGLNVRVVEILEDMRKNAYTVLKKTANVIGVLTDFFKVEQE